MASNRKFNVPINLLSLASNPADADEGDIYYNTTDDRVRVYKNSAWVNLAYADDVGITSIDYITFDTTPEASSTETGTMFWDSGDGLPKVILNANVELGLGQEQVALCKNATGSSIPKGSVVYINGAAGQRPTIALADADTEATSSKTFGLTAETIADGAEGFVVTFGVLRGVNTNGLTEGAAVWLSSTAGGYTTTIPAEPSNAVFIGYVVKASLTAGEILINIQNGYELTELHGVTIENGGSLTDNEVLAYDSASGIWINQTASEAGLATSTHNHTLDSLSNITITGTPADNNLLAYDTATSKWTNQTLAETNIQTRNNNLTAIANLITAADRLVYYTGSGTAALATFTSFGRSLVDDADAATARTTLGLGTMATAATSDYAALSGAAFTGDISTTGTLKSIASAANEGGQIELSLPSSGSTLSGTNVTIDVYQDKLRIFESGGTNRGVYIPLTSAGATVGTSLLSGTTGAMNYAQTEGTKQSGINTAGATIVSTSITTNGYPVQVTVTGDMENNSAGGWVVLQLYRGATAIGNPVHAESSAGSENVPYALSVIDAPSAGTYTYALKLNNSAGGTFNFGESDGPVITAIELSGPKGDTGAAGSSGNSFTTISTTSGTSPVADSSTDTLTLTAGTGISITGDSATDSITIANTGYYSGGTDVALLDGGTNASLTAVNGGIVYSSASAMGISAAGSSGQVLRSGGAGAPTWSTATFPSTATGTGTILRADGTNWVATTATYPSTTTANRILYSSANDVVGQITSANSGVLVTDASGVPSISSTLPVDIIPTAPTATNTADGVGYIGMPQRSKVASGTTDSYAIVVGDAGRHIYVSGSVTAACTVTIPANSGGVAFEIGTTIVIMNDMTGGVVSIAITTDTLQWAGSGGAGSRTLARYGVATITKVTSTKWVISGTGLS